MTKVKVALIGYGHLGKWHAQKAQALENSELIAIVDPSEKSREMAKESFPDTRIIADLDDVMSEIDAGLVVTPTSYHFGVAKKLLENNKHVFCEKPVTATMEEATELAKIAADKNIIFQVGHSERCHQFWEQISEYQEIVDEATIVNVVRNSPFKGRAADVGVVEDLMIHDIDLVRMFCGDPKTVEAFGAKLITDKWDHAKAILKYPNKLVTIENSRNDVKVERSIQFTGPKGVMRVDLFELKAYISNSFEAGKEQEIKEVSYERRDHLLIEQEKFYDSILNGADIFVSLEDGMKALNLVEAVNKALDTGTEVQI
jgi:predicted dehydrogenase